MESENKPDKLKKVMMLSIIGFMVLGSGYFLFQFGAGITGMAVADVNGDLPDNFEMVDEDVPMNQLEAGQCQIIQEGENKGRRLCLISKDATIENGEVVTNDAAYTTTTTSKDKKEQNAKKDNDKYDIEDCELIEQGSYEGKYRCEVNSPQESTTRWKIVSKDEIS